MVDYVEMIRFFAEFIPSVPSGQALSQDARSFVEFILSEANGLRMTSEGLRMTPLTNSLIATQPPR